MAAKRTRADVLRENLGEGLVGADAVPAPLLEDAEEGVVALPKAKTMEPMTPTASAALLTTWSEWQAFLHILEAFRDLREGKLKPGQRPVDGPGRVAAPPAPVCRKGKGRPPP